MFFTELLPTTFTIRFVESCQISQSLQLFTVLRRPDPQSHRIAVESAASAEHHFQEQLGLAKNAFLLLVTNPQVQHSYEANFNLTYQPAWCSLP